MNTANHCCINTLNTIAMIAACCALLSCKISTAENRSPQTAKKISQENAVNINTASAEELEKIPYIGEKTAARIVAHRTANGPFRKVEHVMLVDGIIDQLFRQIKEYVRVE